MAVRSTMRSLILQLRSMVGDDGSSQTFTDERLQQILDGYRTRFEFARLERLPHPMPGFAPYREWKVASLVHTCTIVNGGSWGNFEEGATLYTSSGAVVPTLLNDLDRGVWHVAVSQPDPAYLTGASYCLNSAAASVCEEWATRLSRRVDVRDGESDVKRSQAAKALRESAEAFRRKVPVRSISMVRGDVN